MGAIKVTGLVALGWLIHMLYIDYTYYQFYVGIDECTVYTYNRDLDEAHGWEYKATSVAARCLQEAQEVRSPYYLKYFGVWRLVQYKMINPVKDGWRLE